MGYDTRRFVSEMPPELLCPLCHQVLQDPVQDYCREEHLFCRMCIQGHMNGSMFCPIDKTASLATNDFVRPAHVLLTMLSNLKIRCHFTKNGCSSQIRLSGLDKHVQDCRYDPKRMVDTSIRLDFVDYKSNVHEIKIKMDVDGAMTETFDSLKRKLSSEQATKTRLQNDVKRIKQEIYPEVGRLSLELNAKKADIEQLTVQNKNLTIENEELKKSLADGQVDMQVKEKQITELNELLENERGYKKTLLKNLRQAMESHDKKVLENSKLIEEAKVLDDRMKQLDQQLEVANILREEFSDKKEEKIDADKVVKHMQKKQKRIRKLEKMVLKLTNDARPQLIDQDVQSKLNELEAQNKVIDSLKLSVSQRDSKISHLELVAKKDSNLEDSLKKLTDEAQVAANNEQEWKNKCTALSTTVVKRESRIRELMAKCTCNAKLNVAEIAHRLFDENSISAQVLSLMNLIDLKLFYRPMTYDEHYTESRRVGKMLSNAIKVTKGGNKILLLIDCPYLAICITKHNVSGRLVTFDGATNGPCLRSMGKKYFDAHRLILDPTSKTLKDIEKNGSGQNKPFDIVFTLFDKISTKVALQVVRDGLVVNLLTDKQLDITKDIYSV